MANSHRGGAPLVTVVTPSFNQGEFIAETIESVLSQDYPNLEYTVVDGGSTDRTLEILRGYGRRLSWTSGPDAGQADAIHRGFLAGSGKYLAWLNSDDRYLPRAIATAVAELEAHPDAALVYGNAEYIDRSGASMGPATQVRPWDPSALIEDADYIVQPATLFRRDSYLAVGGLDTSLHYVMDYDLWIRLGERYGVRFTDEVLAQARVYGETKSSLGGLVRLDEIERMIHSHGGRAIPRSFRRELWLELTGAMRSALGRGQVPLALRLGVRASRLAPGALAWRVQRARGRRRS